MAGGCDRLRSFAIVCDRLRARRSMAHGSVGVARGLKHGRTIDGRHALERFCRGFYIPTGALRPLASRKRITRSPNSPAGNPYSPLVCASWRSHCPRPDRGGDSVTTKARTSGRREKPPLRVRRPCDVFPRRQRSQYPGPHVETSARVAASVTAIDGPAVFEQGRLLSPAVRDGCRARSLSRKTKNKEPAPEAAGPPELELEFDHPIGVTTVWMMPVRQLMASEKSVSHTDSMQQRICSSSFNASHTS